MSSNPVSKTETPSVTPPVTSPQPQPQPQQPSMIFSAEAVVSRPTPSFKLGDYGLAIGHGGLRLADDSGLNPVPSFGSLSLGPNNPEPIKFSPGSVKKPVEGSEKKGKSKISFQIPKSAKGKEEVGKSYEVVEAELTSEGEDDGSNKKEEEDEGEGKKTWNLRPRNKKKALKKNSNGGGGRSKGAGAGQSEGQASRLPKIPTRPRTPTRPRAMNNAPTIAAAAAPVKPIFSLTLSKSEIEEDFLKMTGELPPKRNSRRPRNVQKKIDEISPGMFLGNVRPERYQVSDPPPRRVLMRILYISCRDRDDGVDMKCKAQP
ncbi:hypothetical protein RIF29_18256 [Crotalaria pallida]|uniref:Uncharacterized protein n=1 Tax=Crotalaria pallida TaxID=3830 RepID=A0AAN9IKP8_CROPI